MPDPQLLSLSSSEIPAVLHISTWATRWVVMMKFCGRGLPDRADNRMSWGTRLQPLILEQAARDLALEITPNIGDRYIRRGLLGYTGDGFARKPDQGPGVVEAKCCFDSFQWMTAWHGGKTPPAYVEAQVQCQLFAGDGETVITDRVFPTQPFDRLELLPLDGAQPEARLWTLASVWNRRD